MDKPVIIALYGIPEEIENYEYLHNNYNVVHYTLSNVENLEKDMRKKPYCEAVAIYGSYPGFLPLGFMDSKLIDMLPKNLKVIGLSSVGFDGYDLKYLNDKKIKLCNGPVDNFVAMDVADTALWHVLSGIRKYNSWDRLSRNESYDHNTLKIRGLVRNEFCNNEISKEKGFAFGHRFHGDSICRPSNMKCTVLGYGLIGKEVVNRLLVLGMKVNVVVRNKDKYIDNLHKGVKLFTNNEILEAIEGCNLLIICLPGGKETYQIVNEEVLSKMVKNSILVNVGRGSCIDIEGLKKSIDSNKISHLGLDVFNKEPTMEKYLLDETEINLTTNPFFTTSITPHIGSSTEETLIHASFENLKNIMNGLETGEFINVVNNL